MADENDERQGQGSAGPKASRDDRLKSALRENLKRRKLQARERAATEEPARNDDGVRDEGAGKTGA